MHRSRNIFILEIGAVSDLAFEADVEAQAIAITRAPWFRDAIEGFVVGKQEARVVCDTVHIRPATAVEAKIYEELCEEFDGPARQFLVANLAGFPERHAAKPAEASL